MANHIIKGSDEKDKAILATIGISVESWLQHAYDEKARVCIDRIFEVATTMQAKKATEAEKLATIATLEFEPQSDLRQAKDISARIIR